MEFFIYKSGDRKNETIKKDKCITNQPGDNPDLGSIDLGSLGKKAILGSWLYEDVWAYWPINPEHKGL